MKRIAKLGGLGLLMAWAVTVTVMYNDYKRWYHEEKRLREELETPIEGRLG